MITMVFVVFALAIMGTLVLFCGAVVATLILCLIATLIDAHNNKNELDGELYIDIPQEY